MVDDVRDIAETAESKASQELLDRARLARERREAEQRKRLDELRAHAAAAQAQREKRDDDRRKRQAEQRARDDDRRIQVEERKRAIWEASVSRREALLQRERDRTERLERQRAARSAPRPAFAFGSSTPRLLEPVDSGGFFWAARSTNPIDQMNFFETLAASTTNVMFASAPLTRRASALQLDSDNDNKDEPDRSPLPAMWSSVARRRTDLVPTAPAPRAPGRAYSMTRLDRLPHSPHAHIPRTQTRSGETTPGSRPGSALSNATGVVRRPASAPRKPRPASIAGTGVNTPRGGVGETLSQSVATTPSVSRDSTVVCTNEAPRRTPRRPRPLSLHVTAKPLTPPTPGEGKPPLHRKPKTAKEHDKGRGKSSSVSPGRGLSPSPSRSKERILHALDKATPDVGASVVSAAEVTHKLEALHIHNGHGQQPIDNQSAVAEQQAIEANEQQTQINDKTMTQNEPHSEIVDLKQQEQLIEIADVSNLQIQDKNVEVKDKSDEVKDKNVEVKDKDVEVKDKIVEVKEDKKSEEASKTEQKKLEDKKEASVEKTDDSDIMSASMSARRITTEEQAKAALAERRRRAREELEKQAEIERQRLQREAEEEAERQRAEEERQLREEQEARELALLQRTIEEEKLRKAIEAQQQFEREEVERKAREELERQQKVREDEEKRRAAEEAEKQRREEAEREEKERIARKQRVEAIMARTRLRKAEEDKKQQENKPQPQAGTEPVVAGVDNHTANATGSVEPESSGSNNGNVATGDLLGFTSQCESEPAPSTEPAPHNNGNLSGELLDSQPHASEEKPAEATKVTENETTNGNMNLTTISSSFIQHEVATNEATQKIPEKIIEDDFTSHNGHNTINHPLTLQNAI